MGKIFHHTPALEKFAWPGGYQISYHVSNARGHTVVMCPDCATEEAHKARVPGEYDPSVSVEAFVHWEGPPEQCEGCNEEIESEYGDPDNEGEN